MTEQYSIQYSKRIERVPTFALGSFSLMALAAAKEAVPAPTSI